MTTKTFTWGGSHAFQLTKCASHEDTLRIKSNYPKMEKTLQLNLPTLCITYADMKFQNSIGGEQKDYPDSQAYGPVYFDPPVSISGEIEIERLTYIRGAQKVDIGARETIIQFPSWKELIIPRLHISNKTVEAKIIVPKTNIDVNEPLKINIQQLADGRSVGGLRVEKRHPDWKPRETEQHYEAWVQVIDGITRRPLPKVEIDIWHWDPEARGFRLAERKFTDESGGIRDANRPAGELEAFVVIKPGGRTVVRCLRPLAGQRVHLHMQVWPLIQTLKPYIWRKGDTLERMARMCGHSGSAVLEINRLKERELHAGLRMILPCYAATYRLESWDTLDWVGKIFGYKDAAGLAKVNGVTVLNGGEEIKLPDWTYIYAGVKDNLDDIDDRFYLPRSSSITVGRAFHPNPRIPFEGETVALPTTSFAVA